VLANAAELALISIVTVTVRFFSGFPKPHLLGVRRRGIFSARLPSIQSTAAFIVFAARVAARLGNTPMLYDRWLRLAPERRGEIALHDLASGFRWTSGDLKDLIDRSPDDASRAETPRGQLPASSLWLPPSPRRRSGRNLLARGRIAFPAPNGARNI